MTVHQQSTITARIRIVFFLETLQDLATPDPIPLASLSLRNSSRGLDLVIRALGWKSAAHLALSLWSHALMRKNWAGFALALVAVTLAHLFAFESGTI